MDGNDFRGCTSFRFHTSLSQSSNWLNFMIVKSPSKTQIYSQCWVDSLKSQNQRLRAVTITEVHQYLPRLKRHYMQTVQGIHLNELKLFYKTNRPSRKLCTSTSLTRVEFYWKNVFIFFSCIQIGGLADAVLLLETWGSAVADSDLVFLWCCISIQTHILWLQTELSEKYWIVVQEKKDDV